MYKEVGKDWKDKVLLPVVEDTIKNIIGMWNATNLIPNKTKATQDIMLQLKEQLDDN